MICLSSFFKRNKKIVIELLQKWAYFNDIRVQKVLCLLFRITNNDLSESKTKK